MGLKRNINYMETNKVYIGDCLELMKDLPDKSIDMILCDLPYGSTGCSWDIKIPFELLWSQYERIITQKGAIVLTASQPFTSLLISSNLKLFKYCWVWEKSRGSNFVHSKYQPLKTHEDICVFSLSPSAYNKKNNFMNYNPQMVEGLPYNKGIVQNDAKHLIGDYKFFSGKNETGNRYPRSIIKFSSDSDGKNRGLHPTQKPVKLFEYLIKTYTNEGDIVLDNCAGSGTTGIACINLNRKYILIEKEEKYYDIINNRLINL